MSWSISDVTLFALIKGMSEKEKVLFTNYQALRWMINKHSDYDMGINECIMYKNYFDDQLQDTTNIIGEIAQMEQLKASLQKEIAELEEDILEIEQRISSSNLGKVKFLDKYRLEYDQACCLLALDKREIAPEDFVSGHNSVITDFCELTWG